MTNPQFLELDLTTIAGGTLPELFDYELARILANMQDPNTSATKPRELEIRLKLTPAENRETAQVDVSVKAKLAGTKSPASTSIFLERDGEGRAVGYCRKPVPNLDLFQAPKAAETNGGTQDA